MMYDGEEFSLFFVVLILVWSVSVVGWVLNIIKVFGMLPMPEVTTEFVARIVGVFITPLGAVMGYL